MNEIPKALIVLKENLNQQDWNKLRKILGEFLDLKRELNNSNLKLKTLQFLNKALYDQFISRDYSKFSYQSYIFNVLRTLHKIEYDSKIMCFIHDAYSRGKSGNKKYPNL